MSNFDFTKTLLNGIKERINNISWNNLKDRPFYETDPVETILIEETNIEVTDALYAHLSSNLTFVEGQTYTVVFNGTEYECVAWAGDDNSIVIGNGEDVPFICDSYADGECYLNTSEAGIYTIKISSMISEVYKLDEKFLPEDVLIGAKGVGMNSEIFNNYSDNEASGGYSHAEGFDTIASGNYSHAEGGYTTASGEYSHAEGSNTRASKYVSHAEGYGTTASGDYSHAEGNSTTASGDYSHAEGRVTTASGDYSHAEGYSTRASGENQHVQGKSNIEDTENKYAHIVGNGTINKRSNAHTLDWNGNAWYQGTVEATAIILKSPNGTRFKITVGDDGVLSATEITE